MHIPVWVESWQLQCCGDPFELDSIVSWRLTADPEDFIVRALGTHAPDWSAVLPVAARVTDAPVSGVVLSADGVTVFIDQSIDPRPVEAVGALIRLLVEDHHIDVPEDVAPTRGQVSRIDLVRLGYEQLPGGIARAPRPGDAALTEVSRAEKWPEDEVDGRSFAGYLVQLDVEPQP